jgi:3-ketosteroid 9alpha-monooxygenase subunit B
MADFHELKISGIVQETADTRSILFDVPTELRPAFAYHAGQFLTFEIPFQGMRIRRCYSLASAPETDSWHKVTVKRVNDGRVSNWFNDNLAVGDSIHVSTPEGKFVLDAKDSALPITLFGGGSGITPVISLLKSAAVTTKRDIKLIYANRDQNSIIFRDELKLIEKQFGGRVKVHHHLDSERGFLNVELVKQLIAGREQGNFYVCGPGPFMDTVEAAFEAAAIPRERRLFERFVSPLDPDRRPVETTPAPAAGDVPSSYTMVLEGKQHTIPYRTGLTLLKAANEAGVKPPSSCEDGYCGCCMAFMRTGKVHMSAHEALTAQDIQRGWILPCQAKASGAEPLTIDFDEKY